MFSFTIQKAEGKLIVNLPKELKFNLDFLLNMDRLIYRSLYIPNINNIIVRCGENIKYDRMCQSYIINVLDKINKQKNKSVFINKNFKYLIREKVKQKYGDKYETEYNIDKLIKSKELEYYTFNGKESTEKPIKHISRLLSEHILTFRIGNLDDFLNTTIGEIFSNSNNHSDQEEVFFASSVEEIDNQIYLNVSIIDYGTTIQKNVRYFLESNELLGSDCIDWAIQPMNTTRKGSGGHGLPMLIRYMKAAKGSLILLSGESYYSLYNEQEEIHNVDGGYFNGTSVNFTVKLDNESLILIYNPNSEEKIESISLEDI